VNLEGNDPIFKDPAFAVNALQKFVNEIEVNMGC
jgi:hypothetical protein